MPNLALCISAVGHSDSLHTHQILIGFVSFEAFTVDRGIYLLHFLLTLFPPR